MRFHVLHISNLLWFFMKNNYIFFFKIHRFYFFIILLEERNIQNWYLTVLQKPACEDKHYYDRKILSSILYLFSQENVFRLTIIAIRKFLCTNEMHCKIPCRIFIPRVSSISWWISVKYSLNVQ